MNTLPSEFRTRERPSERASPSRPGAWSPLLGQRGASPASRGAASWALVPRPAERSVRRACSGCRFSESGRPSVPGSRLERSRSPPGDESVPTPNTLGPVSGGAAVVRGQTAVETTLLWRLKVSVQPASSCARMPSVTTDVGKATSLCSSDPKTRARRPAPTTRFHLSGFPGVGASGRFILTEPPGVRGGWVRGSPHPALPREADEWLHRDPRPSPGTCGCCFVCCWDDVDSLEKRESGGDGRGPKPDEKRPYTTQAWESRDRWGSRQREDRRRSGRCGRSAWSWREGSSPGASVHTCVSGDLQTRGRQRPGVRSHQACYPVMTGHVLVGGEGR